MAKEDEAIALEHLLECLGDLANERVELIRKIEDIENRVAFLPPMRMRLHEVEGMLTESLRDVRVPVPPTVTETR